jgi:hypothetical protein
MKIKAKDLFSIVSMSKQEIVRLPSNLHISDQKVEECDYRHIAVANSLIVWLNKNNALKELVEFDFTDHSCDYESNEE